ncbi:MAG TPA: hypothetical protein VHB77_16695 [Planctomycetaceae bacterium]|nr:hypothetical protein [Planctomycetaceae bacterium]
MKHQRPLLAVCSLIGALALVTLADAAETDLHCIDYESPISHNFLAELNAANHANAPEAQLEALYQKAVSPAEKAEVELTIARIYCQRTGHVNPAKAIEWYDKALVRDLPPIVLAKQFILRGNMHERLEHTDKALSDYCRGLLVCLQFNLPKTWPAEDGTGHLHPAPIDNSLDPKTAEEQLDAKTQTADWRRDHDATRREQDLLGMRYYYIDAIARVMKDRKLKEPELQKIAERLTNRKDRIQELLVRVREPNPRPWP